MGGAGEEGPRRECAADEDREKGKAVGARELEDRGGGSRDRMVGGRPGAHSGGEERMI